jgi:outer membrane protein TolC
MKQIKRLFAACLLLVAGSLASAAELTLDEARTLALANSKTLAGFNLSTESAALAEKLQFYNSLPSLSLSSTASVSTPTSAASTADSLDSDVEVSISQTLFQGGKNLFLAAIDRISSSIAKETARAEYYSVIKQIDSAWYSLLEARAARDAASAAIDSANLSLSIAKVRYESGAVSTTDYLEAEAEAEAKQTALSQAKRNISVYALTVSALTGLNTLPSITPIDFTLYETLITRLVAYSDSDTAKFIDNLRSVVLANNPDLAKATLTNTKAEKAVSLAAAEYFPTVSASVTGGVNYTVPDGISSPSAKVSLTASVPLDVWKTGVSVASSKLAQRQSALSLSDSRQTVGISMQTAVYDCISEAQSVVSSAKALEYAQKHYENVLALYRLASASTSNLSDASSLVSTNTTNLISARYNFLSGLSAIKSLSALDNDAKVLDLIP